MATVPPEEQLHRVDTIEEQCVLAEVEVHRISTKALSEDAIEGFLSNHSRLVTGVEHCRDLVPGLDLVLVGIWLGGKNCDNLGTWPRETPYQVAQFCWQLGEERKGRFWLRLGLAGTLTRRFRSQVHVLITLKESGSLTLAP